MHSTMSEVDLTNIGQEIIKLVLRLSSVSNMFLPVWNEIPKDLTSGEARSRGGEIPGTPACS